MWVELRRRMIGSVVVGALFLAVSGTSAFGQNTSVVFEDFDAEAAASAWRVTFLGRSPAADLDGPSGVACWAKWCYRVTALADTTTGPGEWTHMSIGIPNAEPYTSLEALIGGSMVVSENDGDYSRQLRSSGGPLMMRGAEWNNQGDNLVDQGESADFCFTAPYAQIVSAPIGMKVGSVRSFDTIAGPGEAACPSAAAPAVGYPGLSLLALAMAALGVRAARRRRPPVA